MTAPVDALRAESWQIGETNTRLIPGPVFTVAEVAGEHRVDPRTVTRWIVTGKLRAYKAGRHWRITESAIAEFVAAGQAVA
jgi:excisionase family DNA binding protein